MKKRGFTLIELLGVLIVLSAILLVTVPAITSSIKRADLNRYNDFVKKVTNASELYVERNRNLFPALKEQNGFTIFTLGSLIQEGYLDSNTVNPKTNEAVSPNELITVYVNDDFTFRYEYPTTKQACTVSLVSESNYIENGRPYFFVNLSNERNGSLIANNLTCSFSVQNQNYSNGLYAYSDTEGHASEGSFATITSPTYQFGTMGETKQIKVYVSSETDDVVHFNVRSNYFSILGDITIPE